jgi:transcriptional regulator with XRE-family HTH domain
MQRRTQERFRDELPRLLAEHGMSQRALARSVGVNQSYLTFVLKGRRVPSRRLVEGATEALQLPSEYFPEYREAVVADRLKADPALLDRVYGLVTRSSRP